MDLVGRSSRRHVGRRATSYTMASAQVKSLGHSRDGPSAPLWTHRGHRWQVRTSPRWSTASSNFLVVLWGGLYTRMGARFSALLRRLGRGGRWRCLLGSLVRRRGSDGRATGDDGHCSSKLLSVVRRDQKLEDEKRHGYPQCPDCRGGIGPRSRHPTEKRWW